MFQKTCAFVGPPFCGAPVRPNMLNMPKSASAVKQFSPVIYLKTRPHSHNYDSSSRCAVIYSSFCLKTIDKMLRRTCCRRSDAGIAISRTSVIRSHCTQASSRWRC